MSSASERIEQLSPLQKAVLALKEMRARLDAVEQARSEPIAVVGLGCRFPGADGPEAFWRLLRDGVDAVGEVPPGRWEDTRDDRLTTRRGGFLSGLDQFDALFF